MNYNEVAARGIRVRMVRNICKVRLPQRSEIDSGIEVYDMIVGKDIIEDTKVIERNFTDLNGKSVKISRMKRGTVYVLVECMDVPAKAIFIPKGRTLEMNNKSYEGGKYVAIAINNRLAMLKKEHFRRMFIIEETPEKFRERVGSAGLAKIATVSKQKKENKTAQETMAEMMREQSAGNTPKEDSSNKRKLKLVAQICDSNDKVLGYAAIDNDGKKFKLSYAKTVSMASKGLIENAVTKGSGSNTKLIGYAMKLDNLTKVYN